MTKALLLLFFTTTSFFAAAQVAVKYDVVIAEIMADPSPVVGLPNAEYVEIRNTSGSVLSMNGWRLSDATSSALLTTGLQLAPDSTLILCSVGNTSLFAPFGRTLGVASFPSLDNDGDVLTLRSPQGKIIHAVAYNSNWYANNAKKEGGWSLEMIDPKNPCGGANNWKASTAAIGGTPGKTNSVNATNTDNTPPALQRAYATDSVTLVLIFNEPLDSASAAAVGHYSISGNTVASVLPLLPLFQSVQLKLATPMTVGNTYSVIVTGSTDCKGNAVGIFNGTKLGLPQTPVARDVVVNEILFNPKSSGADYVELYNRSSKIIDVSKLYMANRSSTGAVASLKKITEEPWYLFPEEYLVLTEDAAAVNRQYLVKKNEALLTLSSLPSLPDDEGNALLVDINGTLVDDVPYKAAWHFGLIDNPEGVALERIDPAGASGEKKNWHSASSTAGFGTPTYRNSQFQNAAEPGTEVVVLPKVFSPDNDGRDDRATIQYKIAERGYVANVFIFDESGRLVRQLVKNELLADKGLWNWDGLGATQNKLPIGNYIIVTELFNLQGKKKSFKHSIVLARPLN